MSNDIVGKLYNEIIEGVVTESRIDFEDSGIDEATLQELKHVWQQRLSSHHVAKLPWEEVEAPSEITIDADGEQKHQQTNSTNTNTPSGLLLPTTTTALSSDTNNNVKIKTELTTAAARQSTPTIAVGGGGLVLPGGGHITQADGPLDDDNDGDSDPDQINSDLDDSDDGLNSAAEDDDDEGGMIMLCLYDKVQRVKNKWKYVLKDGVANINGKDYLFSRGTGESEW